MEIIGNKIPRSSKNSQQNNLEANEEVLKEKCISPDLRKEVIDDLKSIENQYTNNNNNHYVLYI